MSVTQDQPDVLGQHLPGQRHANAPSMAWPLGTPPEEIAALTYQRDEARAFARDLWAATPSVIKDELIQVEAALPSWIPRP